MHVPSAHGVRQNPDGHPDYRRKRCTGSEKGVGAQQSGISAEVYGLLGDAEAMLPLLRRCLTMPNGYHLVQLGEPAFARVRGDPRVRALAAELAAAQARARRTPVGAAQ